ncbi:MAG: peptidase S41, partial [Bacteroidales bacterium]|nr:peptidase S41 [Bacteroidales bacterium]
MRRFDNNITVALLGVVLGVLITMVSYKALEPERKFDGDYNRWRKLNLILQEVGSHYVDTIDMEAMTDAAVSAALAELDPHSVYLPPVELTESETELSGNFEGIGITFNVPNDTAVVISPVQG